MANDPLQLVVFDYDGTLVDSHAGFHRAFAAAFVAIGQTPPGEDDTRALVGLPLREAVGRFVPSPDKQTLSEFSRAMRAARDFMRASNEPPDVLIPGTRTVLETFEQAGVLLGIATNKSRKGLDHSMAFHDIAKFFVATRTADETHAKPHPAMIEELLSETGVEMENAVVIGDTVTDMELARNAGVPAVGVTWGYHDAQTLIECGAGAVIDRYAQLSQALTHVWLPEEVELARNVVPA